MGLTRAWKELVTELTRRSVAGLRKMRLRVEINAAGHPDQGLCSRCQCRAGSTLWVASAGIDDLAGLA
jgi:hypothetical protein